ncbi:E1-like protein-activating enzyme Gsa7p/Apg7p [Halteromyces radiatus]|uniref:E1-like protein-activating enzyme Gsa7p/Apg7p n=1 Tax=Halteromyces radiatus TaxID=101107 RepID=UPI00221FDEF2|nr:E1-like protein-activating enzyme Gsa7p/Apg7p [Halteromyces radiatus]KAI8092479.1 E1-like protein-activating enzyme Gsa7p/Apg7p [Halteromyces radiatus]
MRIHNREKAIDATFWHSLVDKKLNIIQLSQEPQTLQAYYSIGKRTTNDTILPPQLCIPGQALEQQQQKENRPSFTIPTKGTLINTNTLEQFQTMDKKILFDQTAEKIWQSIQTGKEISDPSILTSFLMVTFADLKKYKFYYWFAFPAIIPSSPWLVSNLQSIDQIFTPHQITSLATSYHRLNQPPFFLIETQSDDTLQLYPLNHLSTCLPTMMLTLGFADPSCSPLTPGWPLRNLLAWAHHTFPDLVHRPFRIVCYRESLSKLDAMHSLVIHAEFPSQATFPQPVKSVGWERNVQGKLGPRMADLSPLMDPTRLADTSVDLNLKLMRWRVMPSLNLDKIKQTKCLLLGAGTLGCYVARSLLGWGVRHITFVDNGRVSFSNPVRQPLYRFEDCLNGGSPKAEVAAKQLLDILPTMTAKGYSLSIPMPGHPTTSMTLEQDLDVLMALVQEHDVIFLLTDSRESRWLPSLLGARMDKMVINAALGFDTYLVMRHGPTSSSLGCYFCNDIVAPTDSLTDRTLDQQCTVTRPGLSAMAAALAVELMVSLLQHKDGIYAEADTATSQSSSILGLVPHQIRGFLAQFSNMLIVGQGYERCTACSKKVLDAFDQDPLALVKKVTNDSLVLEQITGLDEMKKQSEDLMDQDWLLEEDDF